MANEQAENGTAGRPRAEAAEQGSAKAGEGTGVETESLLLGLRTLEAARRRRPAAREKTSRFRELPADVSITREGTLVLETARDETRTTVELESGGNPGGGANRIRVDAGPLLQALNGAEGPAPRTLWCARITEGTLRLTGSGRGAKAELVLPAEGRGNAEAAENAEQPEQRCDEPGTRNVRTAVGTRALRAALQACGDPKGDPDESRITIRAEPGTLTAATAAGGRRTEARIDAAKSCGETGAATATNGAGREASGTAVLLLSRAAEAALLEASLWPGCARRVKELTEDEEPPAKTTISEHEGKWRFTLDWMRGRTVIETHDDDGWKPATDDDGGGKAGKAATEVGAETLAGALRVASAVDRHTPGSAETLLTMKSEKDSERGTLTIRATDICGRSAEVTVACLGVRRECAVRIRPDLLTHAIGAGTGEKGFPRSTVLLTPTGGAAGNLRIEFAGPRGRREMPADGVTVTTIAEAPAQTR